MNRRPRRLVRGEEAAARRQKALRLRAEGASLKQVAAAIGVTRERARQILRQEPPAVPAARRHKKRPPISPAIDRILRRIDMAAEHWPWPGYLEGGDPVIAREGGGKALVHRVLWEHLVGPVPPQLVKRCDVDRCVRPWCYSTVRDDAARALPRQQMLEALRRGVGADEIATATGYRKSTVHHERWRMRQLDRLEGVERAARHLASLLDASTLQEDQRVALLALRIALAGTENDEVG